VFHDLSKDYVEVCQFDLGFLSGLMGAPIEQEECMQRGGQSCRLKFMPPTRRDSPTAQNFRASMRYSDEESLKGNRKRKRAPPSVELLSA
jgi:hypothetical protein